MQVTFIGAGPGDPELLTLKGKKALEEADVVIYAGSLVNPEVLEFAKEGAEVHNSATMTLEETHRVILEAVGAGKKVARLHTGDPSIYGAIGEQMELLEAAGVEYEVIPGVSSFTAAAAALKKEFTVPGGPQTVIVTRLAGRTPVPEEEALKDLAKHRASLCIFLSASMIDEVVEELKAGYDADTPVAVVYKATWPDEKVIITTLDKVAGEVKKQGIRKTALILVGDFLAQKGKRSKLYSKKFSHGFRRER
jgi:precorrin-4/cobalt-precorrin-4 C11-methyltransferase